METTQKLTVADKRNAINELLKRHGYTALGELNYIADVSPAQVNYMHFAITYDSAKGLNTFYTAGDIAHDLVGLVHNKKHFYPKCQRLADKEKSAYKTYCKTI